MGSSLHLVLLGSGKTGSLVAEVAHERGHKTTVLTDVENPDGVWLTAENLRDADAVVDFTAPEAVLTNIAKCIAASKPMVVGTTGWYGEMKRVQQEVERAGTGFVFGANFSYGINLFFQIARAAAPALQHGYNGHITERHHIHKKDAPSGTAVALQRVVEQACGTRVEITSEREGDVMGDHTLELVSGGDRIALRHSVSSRRTFAQGAVLAAEWVVGKTGFYDFKDIFGEI
ncbi:MAG TPA: dihydrodipicolinate reductase C-terminal domain-containing protein [Candidatus Methylomirabilis sp.]|nr:dihydrodipicolinate reductase C-terminal domain-containing protein [Candidatus Methylomirabilis sp.]